LQNAVNMLNIQECNVGEDEIVTIKDLTTRFSNLKKENKKLKERKAELQLKMEQVQQQEREEMIKLAKIEY